MDGIRGARIFRFGFALEIERARRFIDDDVFEHGPEAVRCSPDFGFRFLREPNNFRVTAAFEIEDTVGRPAVFVVADERAFGICGERGFPRSREAEEDRTVAVGADVGRAMHRHHVAQRHEIIHDGEDGFLDLARIPRAADEHDFTRHVHEDERSATRSIARGLGDEFGRVDHGKFRREIDRRDIGCDEEIAREERVPCVLRDDANGQTIPFVGTDERIECVDLALGKIRRHTPEQSVERFRVDRFVRVAPIDMRFASRFAHEKLIFWRATRMFARFHHELPVGTKLPFAAPQGVLVQRAHGQVSMHGDRTSEPELFEMIFKMTIECGQRENGGIPPASKRNDFLKSLRASLPPTA